MMRETLTFQARKRQNTKGSLLRRLPPHRRGGVFAPNGSLEDVLLEGPGCYSRTMATDQDLDFPGGTPDERELLLRWLGYLRGAILRKVEGVSDTDARWRPDGKLMSLLGVVNHLTHVEWRWIDGHMRGEPVSRSEQEFNPGPELNVATAVVAYRQRGHATDAWVRSTSLDQSSPGGDARDLRWVLLHLINETARHAGHADATRQLLDGTTGE